MKRKRGYITIVLLALAAVVPAAAMQDKALLLRAYFRVLLIQQVSQQAQSGCGHLLEQDATQVQEALTIWSQQQTTAARQELAVRFGEQSRERFAQFVTAYSTAEGKNDTGFLQPLAAELGLGPSAGASYVNLRQTVANQWLQADIQNASQLLSNLQTWLKLRPSTPNLPPLQAWLDRDQQSKVPLAAAKTAPPPTGAQLLAAAEAGVTEFKAPATEENAPRNLYAEARKQRQARRMEESQAAMQQIAGERQAAEQEYAAKKQSEARADAEAIRGQAQKLAAVEQQSLEQQKNSWSSKLKAVVGTTISAAGGAFLGGVGAQAGQRAADELFR